MSRSFRLSFVALFAVSLSVSACGKKKMPAQPAPPPPPAEAETSKATPTPPPAPPPAPTPTPTPKTLSEEEVFASTPLDELNRQKPLVDAFFAYDSTELNEAARSALQKNSEWMKRWKSTKVMVEGHADNRGTNEYNFALAERRAKAVRDYLAGLGIPADRITIVSKGEEGPFCTEDTEACWQQNRVGHFIVTAK
jgi:peptidoglycan-associated lipoprotein